MFAQEHDKVKGVYISICWLMLFHDIPIATAAFCPPLSSYLTKCFSAHAIWNGHEMIVEEHPIKPGVSLFLFLCLCIFITFP